MKFKLDENFGSRSLELLLANGHDAETVYQEKLNGASDQTIFAACRREQRCLPTLDLDFADVVRFPPFLSAGVAVFRLPNRASLGTMESMVRDLLQMLKSEPIEGRLWIVESWRIRVHERTPE